jgi:hypothetical protein
MQETPRFGLMTLLIEKRLRSPETQKRKPPPGLIPAGALADGWLEARE